MLRKVLAILMLTLFILNNTVIAAEGDEDMFSVYTDRDTVINGVVRKDISYIEDVGNGYLVDKKDDYGNTACYFTSDFINFKEVNVYVADEDVTLPGSATGVLGEIIWADGVYIARMNDYDTPAHSGRFVEKLGNLYILDTDFQLIKKIQFDWYVREISCVDGIYYVRLDNTALLKHSNVYKDHVDKVYSSSDLINWSERPDFKHVPLSNGLTTVIHNDDVTISTFNDNAVCNNIVYEKVNIAYRTGAEIFTDFRDRNINVVGDYYIIPCNDPDKPNIFWVSKDGIYFTLFSVPEKYRISTIENAPEYISIGVSNVDGTYFSENDGEYSHSIYLHLSKNKINEYLQEDNIYIQLNDKILGFDQPPVMEDDRTLVPMRFLFEQMGAEVTWDEATQAATATINTSALGAEGASATGRATLSNSDISFPNLAKTEKSVTFSVDNTTATVNGTIATMDVPARLINDQTFVPLRFLSENLGYTVDWDEATNTAIITTE